MNQRTERAIRTIASLPDTDAWQPEDFMSFAAAQTVLRDEVARAGRREAQKPRQRPNVRVGSWSLNDARRAVRDRSGGDCEARTPVCTGIAVHVHHKRGRNGRDPHNPELLLHVCSACHDHIHHNVADSYEAGWLLKRLGVDR